MNPKRAAILLMEFDAMKGPVIRKKHPDNFAIPTSADEKEFLMWAIRANAFSVRKLGEHTAYAKGIALTDPNFSRKKRQFGLSLVTRSTIELERAEQLLDKVIELGKQVGENKPYFKMLQGLLQTIEEIEELDKLTQTKEGNGSVQQEESNPFKEALKQQSKLSGKIVAPEVLTSTHLRIFNQVQISDTLENKTTFVEQPNRTFSNERSSHEKITVTSGRIEITIESQQGGYEGLEQGLDMLSRIFEGVTQDKLSNEKILAGVEYLDRLLWEDVDLVYFVPFLQYLVTAESYRITEFNNEAFAKQLTDLQQTHGEWIECFLDQQLDGLSLTVFFDIAGIKREALEFLIDLLFVKLIAIY